MMTISVDHSGLDRDLDRIGAAFSDGRVPLRRFYQYFRAVCLKAWTVRAEGGNFRNQRWRAMASQYFRRTDSVTVPAWGGVKRIREGFKKAGKWADADKTTMTPKHKRGVSTGVRMKTVTGNVSGRLRRSHTRVTRSSIIMRDTGEFQKWVFPPRPDITKQRLRLGGEVEDWRAAQLKRWPLLFFLPEDQAMLQKIAEDYAREIIANKQGGDRAA